MNTLLVHGLGRTPCSMFGLGAALRRVGHRTQFFGYSPTLESLPRVVDRLAHRLRTLSHRGEPVGLAGHSLGGVLLRKALLEVPELPVRNLVLMGTPNRPPRMAAYFWRWRAFRWFSGSCGRFLASPDAVASIPPPTVPYTLISGTAGPARLLFTNESNDGIVAVSETKIVDSDSPRLVPAFHSFIMDHPAVQAAVRLAMMTAHDAPH